MVGGIMAPMGNHSSESVNMLPYIAKRIFAILIKGKGKDKGRLSWIIQDI